MTEESEIKAQGRADVQRLGAWHGLAVDLTVVLVLGALAWRGTVAPEAVVGLLGGVFGARLARSERGKTDGAILPLLVGVWGAR